MNVVLRQVRSLASHWTAVLDSQKVARRGFVELCAWLGRLSTPLSVLGSAVILPVYNPACVLATRFFDTPHCI